MRAINKLTLQYGNLEVVMKDKDDNLLPTYVYEFTADNGEITYSYKHEMFQLIPTNDTFNENVKGYSTSTFVPAYYEKDGQ